MNESKYIEPFFQLPTDRIHDVDGGDVGRLFRLLVRLPQNGNYYLPREVTLELGYELIEIPASAFVVKAPL